MGTRLEEDGIWVEVYAHAHLPTRSGEFQIIVFRNNHDEKEHMALIRGDIRGGTDIPVRLHSECLTGDVLGSLRCDCRDQLEMAMDATGKADKAILLYMRQEGRGIGLGNKIRAYALQEAGLDTVEANEHLGFDDDLRDYTVAALMLRMLGVKSITLATNNPRKIFGLHAHGIEVTGRKAIVSAPTPYNRFYLETKVKKSGHIISFS
ncbi:GTP cyclohydrolase II [Myxococcota bacterium]|nr:GTP cyclohydrolase II [Myxococcota bacterium]